MSAPPSARAELVAAFRARHRPGDPFVLPNPWDAGSARLLASLGFQALGTTSAGLAHSRGRPDGRNRLDRATTLANAGAIAAATRLPVSADLESCFATEPGGVAETIRLAAAAGLAGGSIEDATGDPARPIHDRAAAVDRVVEAVEAARATGLVLTARAENYLYGQADLADTIDRLQRYGAAGADVLYAPALPDLDAIRTVCAEVGRPVNVLADGRYRVAELAEAGAARISLGSGLSRTAFGAIGRAARQILDQGRFDFLSDALPYAVVNELMGSPT